VPLKEAPAINAATKYLMIKSLSINNFRCFRKLSVSDLSRVNVLVGENGAGKTALLEAIFIASGSSPELALRLRAFRGMGTTLEVRSAGVEGLWKNLFHDFDQRKSIDIGLDATDLQSRSVSISLGASEELRLPLGSGKRLYSSQRSVTAPIEFAWTDANRHVSKVRPTILGDKISFQQQARNISIPNRVVFIPSNFKLDPEETAKRLSALSMRNASQSLVDVLTNVYPDVEALSVENSDGSWEVFAQIRDRSERIPIALHSSGASRLVGILLAIAEAERGVVLIDELENGFYYKTLGKIWTVLLEMATQFKCQLFASTHSSECIKALGEAINQDSEGAFCLLNIENRKGASSVSVSTGEVMAAAIDSGFEIR